MCIKRTLSFGLVLALCLGITAGAHAPRHDKRKKITRDLSTRTDIFCDDFMIADKDFEDMGYEYSVAGNSSISLAKTEGPDGEKQQALLLSDKTPGTSAASVVITKDIGIHTKGTLGLKMRFKMEVSDNKETDFASNGIYFLTPEGKWATRFFVAGNVTGGEIQYQSSNSYSTELQDKIVPGKWYTLSMNINIDKQTASLLLECDELKDGYVMRSNVPMFIDFVSMETPAVSAIMFESRMFTADWYIDYLQITENAPRLRKPGGELLRPTPIEIPVTETPSIIPGGPYEINVMKDGIYAYFSSEPYLKNTEVMVGIRSAFRLFEMDMVISEGKYIGEKDGVKVIVPIDASYMTVNGVDVSSGKYELKDSKGYISINELAKALGKSPIWDESTKTLTIN